MKKLQINSCITNYIRTYIPSFTPFPRRDRFAHQSSFMPTRTPDQAIWDRNDTTSELHQCATTPPPPLVKFQGLTMSCKHLVQFRATYDKCVQGTSAKCHAEVEQCIYEKKMLDNKKHPRIFRAPYTLTACIFKLNLV